MKNKFSKYSIYLLVLIDLFLIFMSYWVGIFFKYNSWVYPFGYPMVFTQPLLPVVIALLALWAIILGLTGVYSEKKGYFYKIDEAAAILYASTIASILLIIFTFLIKEYMYSRTVIVFAWYGSIILLSLSHLLYIAFAEKYLGRSNEHSKMLFINGAKYVPSTGKKKMTHMIVGRQFGGAPLQVLQLMRHFANEYDISLICAPEKQLISEAQKLPIRICPNNYFVRLPSFYLDLKAFLYNYFVLRAIRPDILHGHCMKAGYMSAVLGRLVAAKNILFTNHGWPFSELPGIYQFIIKNSQKLISFLVDKLVCVSEADLETAKRDKLCQEHKLLCIHNGIEEPHVDIKPKSSGYFDMLFVGRLVATKDPYALIKAVSLLEEKNVRLFIIGSGDEENEVNRHIENLKLTGKVFLEGERDHEYVMNKMAGSDLFVLTTNREGLPLSILEAMSLGKPVVANNIGGIPEEVIDGRNGYLIKPGDHRQLAEKIELLIKNKDLRESMGAEGKQIFNQKFSLNGMLSKYEHLYRSLNA